jgi:hypothetical protein
MLQSLRGFYADGDVCERIQAFKQKSQLFREIQLSGAEADHKSAVFAKHVFDTDPITR